MEQLKVCSFALCVLNFIFLNSRAETVCDKSQCRGPIHYYKELKCIPVYATSDSCCPYKYNCDHLKHRSHNKCYIGNSVYDIDEDLSKYDTNPCDIECTCRKTSKRASFYCSVVDCPSEEIEKGCYLRRSATKCCAEVVCPEEDEILTSCVVDGEIYVNGEEFIRKSNPNQLCYCDLNNSKENTKLHCRENDQLCNSEIYFRYNESCVPVYFPNDSPRTDCSFIYRCYNQNDQLIKGFSAVHQTIENNMVCKFGDLVLEYGDQLVRGIGYDTCMNCTCEVGPMLTCQRFSDEICSNFTITG